MKLKKTLQCTVKIIGFFFIGLVLNVLITVYSAQTGGSKQLTAEGCYGADYIISGIPVRDVHIREFKGGECAPLHLDNGYTGIGTTQFVINWLFWSGTSHATVNYFQQRHRKNKK